MPEPNYNPAHVSAYVEMTHRITRQAEEAAAKIDVEKLPRRTAHAVHALLVATRELGMPATAAEVIIYDEEALTAQSTGAALREAQRLGLAMNANGYWVATFVAAELRTKLEERYMRDTERLGDD